MNPEERAALERLLEYVGRGFCAVQADCRMLRKYLADLPAPLPVPSTTDEPSVARMMDAVNSGRTSVGSWIGDDVVYVLSNAQGGVLRLRDQKTRLSTKKQTIAKKRKR